VNDGKLEAAALKKMRETCRKLSRKSPIEGTYGMGTPAGRLWRPTEEMIIPWDAPGRCGGAQKRHIENYLELRSITARGP